MHVTGAAGTCQVDEVSDGLTAVGHDHRDPGQCAPGERVEFEGSVYCHINIIRYTHTVRQFRWPLLAQVLLSVGQVTLTLIGTTALVPEHWGALALVLSVHYVALATLAGVTQPVLTWCAGDPAAADAHRAVGLRLQVAAALPAALTVGVVAHRLALGWGAAALAVALLGAAAWNAARTTELASGRFRRAAAGDAVHLAVLALGATALAYGPPISEGTRVVVVTGSLAVATWSAAATLLLRQAPGTHVAVRTYLRTVGRDIPWMMLDGFLVGCVPAAVVTMVGWTSGLVEAGAVRTSTTLVAGPLQMALVAVSPLLVARFRREADQARAGNRPDRRIDALRSLGSVTAAAAAIAVVAGTAAAVALPLLTAPGALLADLRVAPAPAVLLLAVALWLASTTTAFMRYRRSWRELMALRLVTLGASLGTLVVTLAALGAPVPAAIASTAVPWLVLPWLHAVLRWRPVAPTA